MSFSKLSALVFGVIFIIILYFIIYYALKIMYKDVKSGGRRRPPVRKKTYGIEVIDAPANSDIKKGSVIPVRGEISLGRKEINSLILHDQHVSGVHAKLFIKNEVLFVEDLDSTNGKKITGRVKLFANDEIRIGTSKFRVLG